ncbi:hypothetical protein E2C01_010917 [Portunus trituberculatus]|uniref:Uncharacterized protein n=1 Tax=Portunus trituberculatus TaxID=210409 RepID=A0A5B7DA53_PORTR|nr:hypothetical protein [Portunus trituberculatus]
MRSTPSTPRDSISSRSWRSVMPYCAGRPSMVAMVPALRSSPRHRARGTPATPSLGKKSTHS